MTSPFTDKKLESLYTKACGNNREALAFLICWAKLAHRIDDIVDKDITTPEEIIRTFVLSTELFSCNFYVANRQSLLPILYLVFNDYADSEKMKGSSIAWKRDLSDQLRFCGNNLIKAVAGICCGYDVIREISEVLWEDSNKTHHDEKGNSI